MRVVLIGSLLLLLVGCSDKGGSRSMNPASEGGGGAQGTQGSGAAAGDGDAGAAASGTGADGEGGSAAGAGPSEVAPLPEGSRELDGVVNLVDAQAAQDLEEFLSSGMGDLTRSLNLFLTHYEEQYDFVFFFTDHELPNATAAGRFQSITSEPQSGTGHASRYLAEGMQTDGRVKGAIGVQYGSGPFAHEIAHHWAVALAPSFGFGTGKMLGSTPHWGFAGVNGILGGFDPSSLTCQTPPGGAPMNCDPTPEGRYRYVVDSFSPVANARPYAPLELYLMGLAPADEVGQIPVLLEAEEVPGSFDPDTGTEVIDAAGISVVTVSDVVARHGAVSELPEDERHFASAFVVISAAPASDAVLAQVALQAAAFGGQSEQLIESSFAATTGRRATMDTQLGPRRSTSNPPPLPRPAFRCDALAQDCEDDLACHASYCAIPGNILPGQTCELSTDCVAGSHCVHLSDPPMAYCAQYCDPEDSASSLACASLCVSTVTYVDENGEPTETLCGPPP